MLRVTSSALPSKSLLIVSVHPANETSAISRPRAVLRVYWPACANQLAVSCVPAPVVAAGLFGGGTVSVSGFRLARLLLASSANTPDGYFSRYTSRSAAREDFSTAFHSAIAAGSRPALTGGAGAETG